METILLVKAIQSIRPGSEFSFENGDYSTIKWDVLEGEAPTLKEVQEAAKAVEKAEAEAEAAAQASKTALLERLGITADEAALLLK
jgi:hypothetical protein